MRTAAPFHREFSFPFSVFFETITSAVRHRTRIKRFWRILVGIGRVQNSVRTCTPTSCCVFCGRSLTGKLSFRRLDYWADFDPHRLRDRTVPLQGRQRAAETDSCSPRQGGSVWVKQARLHAVKCSQASVEVFFIASTYGEGGTFEGDCYTGTPLDRHRPIEALHVEVSVYQLYALRLSVTLAPLRGLKAGAH